MKSKFSQKTKKELKNYVYVYSDPDTGKPFYIGKGKNDRVFEHLSDSSESEKVAHIKWLKERGLEPKIDILVHGVDENTAFKVEAAAIDLIGLENLTNIQKGHESGLYGRVNVDVIDAKYNNIELTENDFDENAILFKIGEYYENGMSAMDLYDFTRGVWKIDRERAEKAKHALTIVDGQVIEVYEIKGWFDAYSTQINRKYNPVDKDRLEFVGCIANDKIRSKYLNKSVVSLFNGSRSRPFVYVEVKK